MKKFLPKTAKNQQGFTLIELMVVISIIAILSVIGITIFTGAQKTARDSARRADIEAISKALEVHYGDTNCGADASNPYCPITATTAPILFAGGIPQDPSGGSYIGIPAAKGATYNVCADLEADSRAPTDTSPSDFCRTQQQ